MTLPDFLSCFSRQLNVRNSRECARPCGKNGACICRFALFCIAHGSHKSAWLYPFVSRRLRHAPDIRLTPRFKTLQSP